jgi:hypothetical protein
MRVGSSVAERDIDLCIQQAEVAREGQKNLAENGPLARPAALLSEQSLAVQAVQWSARLAKARP